jgi:hypothetical protein
MTLLDLLQDVAAALEPLKAEIDDLNIYAGWWDNPTPPAIDVYPGSPFQTFAGFGQDNQVFLTVRARVAMSDVTAGQQTLLRLLDSTDPASVERALFLINISVVESGVSGFSQYADDAPVNERMIGCEWRVTTFT